MLPPFFASPRLTDTTTGRQSSLRLAIPFRPAQFGNTVLAAKPVQHDPDLVFNRIVLASRPANVFDDLFGRHLRCLGFLSHLRSLNGYDEPEHTRSMRSSP